MQVGNIMKSRKQDRALIVSLVLVGKNANSVFCVEKGCWQALANPGSTRLSSARVPPWRNGRRMGLKIPRGETPVQVRTPAGGTNRFKSSQD